MSSFPPPIEALIREFNKLPGIGHKTSERFIFHLLKQSKTDLTRLSESILALRDGMGVCSTCYNFSEKNPCALCSDTKRSPDILCVVAESTDVFALERAGIFRGLYHVLGGTINGLESTSPSSLRIPELLTRLRAGIVRELILATNPDPAGEATAFYIQQQCAELPVRVTRLARGLPMGSNIEYADQMTLESALEGRQEIRQRNA